MSLLVYTNTEIYASDRPRFCLFCGVYIEHSFVWRGRKSEHHLCEHDHERAVRLGARMVAWPPKTSR